MANYEGLKSAIQQVVKTNGNNEITGALLQQSLLAMINSLGVGYMFMGVAIPTTNPGIPDAKVFYIANGTGTYTNFDGISITEDEVVILYYDSAWHKLLTGIASQDKLAELEQDVATKQDALTLTIKDNGNIVIANIQGQSKEFMPATPSGDPMHYAYEAAGAVWNGTGADIVKTAPWADMVDDDADKVVTHKAGYWYLNGLGDITNEQMRIIFIETNGFMATIQSSGQGYYSQQRFRVNLPLPTYKITFGRIRNSTYLDAFRSLSNLEAIVIPEYDNGNQPNWCFRPVNIQTMFAYDVVLKHISGLINLGSCENVSTPFLRCYELRTIKLYSIKYSIDIQDSPKLTSKSILYMITNEAATSAITITLHADAYARAMANADIVAALQAHHNVSLASA